VRRGGSPATATPFYRLPATAFHHSTSPYQIGLEETIIKENEQNQLTWYEHVQRTEEGRLPKTALKWMLREKRAQGRPKKNWMEGIKKTINKRNLSKASGKIQRNGV
jgi:hypothetical protein